MLTPWQACFILASLLFLAAYGVGRFRLHQVMESGVRLPGQQLYLTAEVFVRVLVACAVIMAEVSVLLFRRGGLRLPAGFLPYSGRWSGWGTVCGAMALLALPLIELPKMDLIVQMQAVLAYLFYLLFALAFLLLPAVVVWAVRSRFNAIVPPGK